MKRIYRGFKTECPTGLITEEAFQGIYSKFFPQGGKINQHFRNDQSFPEMYAKKTDCLMNIFAGFCTFIKNFKNMA